MGLDRTEIADQLREGITSGQYRAGQKLPGYRQLARSFGAAPNTVGEAVRLLADEGLVTTKAGASAVVRNLDEVAVAPTDRAATVQETLTEVRAELRDARERLQSAEKRVADLLTDQ